MDVQQSSALAPGRGWPHVTGTGREAEALHHAGLNPFPVIPASKNPFGPHGFLATTRLHGHGLAELVEGSNLAEYMGRMARNLFALDCDSWESFGRVGAELDRRGIAAWVRNGVDGGQYWLLCVDGEIANAKVGSVEVLGNRCYAMAPPSIHPSGMVYEWLRRDGPLPPVVSLDQLDFLPLRLESWNSRRRVEKRSALPPVADRVLVEGDSSGYASDSEAEFAACLSMIGAGFSDADILDKFSLFHAPHFVKVGETNFARSVLDKARRKHETAKAGREGARPFSLPAGEAHSSAHVAWAESRPWPGRTGSTDRAVYLALCERLRRDGKMPFRASVREVAELAGGNKETACNALRRLQEAGLVQDAGQDGQAGASLYRLAPVPSGDGTAVSRTVGETYTTVGGGVRTSADAWHRCGLGKSALDCWTALRAASGLSVTQIADNTGRAQTTVRRALTALAEHGLAHKDDGQWHAREVSSADLDRVALACGTAGRGRRRTETHREQRERRASAMIQEQRDAWRRGEPRPRRS